MADEVLESCLNNFRDYNMKSYLSMREELALVSSQLCSIEQSTFWSMENIGKALWTAAMLSIYDTDNSTNESVNTEKVSGKKRSREPKRKESEEDQKSVESQESVGVLPVEESQVDVSSSSKIELKRTLSGRVRKDVERYGQRSVGGSK
jgi:hypothetical protein